MPIPVLLLAFVFLCVVFGIPALSLCLEHQRKMAMLFSNNPEVEPKALAATAEEVKELRDLVVDLSLAVDQMRSELRLTHARPDQEASEYNVLH